MLNLLHLQEGKTARSGGGFSGKGFKFDESEAMAVSEKKKFQKAALGWKNFIFFFNKRFVKSYYISCF